MQHAIIYLYTDNTNSMKYVGYTRQSLKRRHSQHINSKSDGHFARALRSHGPDNFTLEILYMSADHNHTFSVMEQYFIEQYDSIKNGYNSCKGGQCGPINPATKISEETKKKISDTMKAFIKKNGNVGRQGKKHSTESIKKMSDAKKGKPSPFRVPTPAKSDLEALYNQPMNMTNIGRIYGVSNVTAKKWFVELNIELRSHSQAIKLFAKNMHTKKP